MLHRLGAVGGLEGGGKLPASINSLGAAVSAAVCSNYTEPTPNGQPTSAANLLFVRTRAGLDRGAGAFLAPRSAIAVAVAAIVPAHRAIEVRLIPGRPLLARLDRLRLDRR